jgi:hypothetical protein
MNIEVVAACEPSDNLFCFISNRYPGTGGGPFCRRPFRAIRYKELWLALCLAPEEVTDVGGLLRLTRMSRPTLYRRPAEHAKAGHVVQVNRGRCRAVTTEEPPR